VRFQPLGSLNLKCGSYRLSKTDNLKRSPVFHLLDRQGARICDPEVGQSLPRASCRTLLRTGQKAMSMSIEILEQYEIRWFYLLM